MNSFDHSQAQYDAVHSKTHTINQRYGVAVATDYYWIPITADTPRGVKVQLLTIGGGSDLWTLGWQEFFFHTLGT